MKICLALTLPSLIWVWALNAQPPLAGKKKWQQGVRYQIEAQLDTTAKRLNAEMRIFYQNNSPDTLKQIYLQVPSNAFHDEENTAVKEMQRFGGDNIDFDQDRGYKLTIESLQFLSIGEQTEFPLQAYDFSDTILDLTLPYDLMPGDTLSLGLLFRQDFVRSAADYGSASIPTDFIHWFPRLTVYDQDGWHPEPFHFMMESFDVYSEFAEFDVTLTVPGNYILVGGGEIISGDPGWQAVAADTSLNKERFAAWHDSVKQQLKNFGKEAGPRTVRFRGDKLQNLTWSASPDFVYYAYHHRIPVHIFYSSHEEKSEILDGQSRFDTAFDYLEDHFGPYPFLHLSIVTSTSRPMAEPMMARLIDSDFFALGYELSSIYFPGVVANNGVDESWLAKGIQTYMGKSLSENIYPEKGYDIGEAQEEMNFLERQYPLPSIDALVRNFGRLYMESGQNEAISKPIHEYKDPIGAISNLYLKSEIFYEMLHFVVGDSVFKESLRELVQSRAFTHIRETDLQSAFEAKHGQNLDWFFDQWLHGTPTVDYSKGDVKQYKAEDERWVTEVELNRKGDGIMPVDVELDLGDNEKIVKRWDGKAESGTVRFETEEKPKNVDVDPNDRIMDSNPLNNRRTRIEFKPDLPLMKYIHMPGDAILVLWRPLLGYNKHDSIRLGVGTRSSYRAFYRNLTLEAMFGVDSKELDAKFAYSQPLSRRNLLNRYYLLARKNEGRFEVEAHLEFKGSDGIISTSGRALEIGLNYSGLLNDAYTFRKVANDTGKVRIDEWEDRDVLFAYLEGRLKQGFGPLTTNAGIRVEAALPSSDAKFAKLSSRLTAEYRKFGFTGRVRGNLATSFGPDRLPLQDQFRAEGAAPRERFHHDIVKTGDGLGTHSHQYVDGGGFLRGYAGQPLPAERFTTFNLEFGPSKSFFILRLFGFYDTGRVWTTRGEPSFTRSDAGVGLKFFGDGVNLFGGNLSLFSSFSAKLYFPLWLSDPPPGEARRQFRWYFTLGKGL